MKKEQPVAEQQPATFPNTLPAVRMDAGQFKSVRKLTRDLNTLTRLGQVIMCCQSELYTIDMPDPGKPGETRPVGAIDILDCLAGEEITLVCGSVLYSTLKREKEPLTGRYFAVRAGMIPPNKRYYKPEIVELERSE